MKIRTALILGLALLFLASCTEQADDGETASQPAVAESVTEEAAAGMTAAEDTVGTVEEAAEEVVEEVVEADAEAEAEAEAAKVVVDEGAAYLYINANKPGVKVTESGLQFEILTSGDGASPSLTSKVVTHYHGTFTNGEVFDSSVERGTPAEFPVNRVIKGWTEALQMMKEGDKWRLVIPSDLAYGERGAGSIAPNSVLIFEVELIEVK